MRKLIMWNMVTLDGLFEGAKSWDLDWHNYVWGDELERLSLDQLNAAGMLLFGRNTYQGMAAYWPTATGESGDVADLMNTLPKVVFSRSLEVADWNNTRLIRENAEAAVLGLKQQAGKDLFIFGSASLCSSFTEAGLIDEYRLGLNPLILGGGTPLFKPGPAQHKMRLLEARPLKSGVILLRYEPVRDEGR
jgi:dihydrofolate reductase